MPNAALASLPADPGRRLSWIPLDASGEQQILVGCGPSGQGPVLAALRRTPTGDRAGQVGSASVRVRVSGQSHVRVRLLLEPRGADLASFAPDWSGLGPIELADGARYSWGGGVGRPEGAVIRDEGGVECVRLTVEGPEDCPTGRVVVAGGLPAGHVSALATLGWALVLRERAQGVLPVAWTSPRPQHEDWV